MNEKISDPTNESPIIESPSKESDLIDIEQESNNSRASQEKMWQEEVLQKKDYEYLGRACETLFKANGTTFAHFGEDAFSGDAATIMVLISAKDEEGKDIPRLFKVGWGEFSKKTFESGQYLAFENFPHDIYCVSQRDSYFADEELIREMEEDPKKYLSEHSIFASRNGQVQVSTRLDLRTRHLDREIQAIPYEDMLRTVRNQIIQVHTTPEEFAAFLRELPDNPVALGIHVRYLYDLNWLNENELKNANEKEISDNRKKHLLHLFTGMGVNTYGMGLGAKESMESMLELKKQFNFETNFFK